jgi:hypothetical protein
MNGLTRHAKPIEWRESPRFGQALAKAQDVPSSFLFFQLTAFVSSTALWLTCRTIWNLAGGNNPIIFSRSLVLMAGLAGCVVAFFIPWMFRHSFGHVRIDREGIRLIRLSAAPRGFYLAGNRAAGLLADCWRVWTWAQVEGLAVETISLGGRDWQVLIISSSDRTSHPIAGPSRANIAGVLALAEAAGLQAPSDRTSASVDTSLVGGVAPG